MRIKNVERLRRNCNVGLEQLERELENQSFDQTTIDEVQAHFKSIPEDLRSALDYVAHDICDYIGVAPKRMLYFPYVYPKKDIDQKEEFAEKMNRDFGLLKMKNGALYSILEGTLDKNWIKELWEYINPVKHENLHPISKRYTKLGPNITIGGTFTQNPGGKIIINDGKGNERVITEAFKFSPDDAIPEKVRDVFTQEEKLSKSDASNLCCKMRVWLQEESELLKMIYLQIGQTMES